MLNGKPNRSYPEYFVWNMVRDRCVNPKNKDYRHYGGRGISVCERWSKSFYAFYEDMGPRPSKDHTLERIDNDGDYCPENCRWATWVEQANNKRNNRLIEFNGETHTLQEWSRITGIKRETISDRLNSGWSIHQSLTSEVGEYRKPRSVTHCPKGHEYTPENTVYQKRGSSMMKSCRECRRIRCKERYYRKRKGA